MGNSSSVEKNRKRAEFERVRKEGFEEFRKCSLPENLVNDERIGGGNLTEMELEALFREITALDLQSLVDRLQAKDDLNAYTVLCAYTQKMLDSQTRLNCVAEVIREAFDTAEKHDKLWYNSDSKPPIYGVPFSVKCDFDMNGYHTAVKRPAEAKKDCPLVEHLKNLGGIPFVLTNVSQGFLSSYTSAPYGAICNPWALDCTPGGSSGGDAALVADGGAPFGTGSDLGGTLRIPAAFCGLVTLKPTKNRFHVSYNYESLSGRRRLGLGHGFFTKSVREQVLLLQLVIGSSEYRKLEPTSAPAPLRMDLLSRERKLRIGYYEEDGFNSPVPSNRRAVHETVTRLQEAGHEVVLFRIEDIDPMFQPFRVASMFFKNTMPSDGKFLPDICDSELKNSYPEKLATTLWLNDWTIIRSFSTPIVSLFSKRAALIARARGGKLTEIRRNQADTDIYKLKFIEYWKRLEIDALVCPSFCTPTIPHSYFAQLANTFLSTGLFNMLDFPAGIVPAGKVTVEDIADLNDEKMFLIDDLLLKKQRDACANSEAMPNAVQVVGLPNEEETVLEVMRIVETFYEPLSKPSK